MKTAVIILNWNGWRDTTRCLDSVLPLLQKEDFLFIVDNGSSDESVIEIDRYLEKTIHKHVKCAPENLEDTYLYDIKTYLVCNRVNGGFSAGNNLVLKQLRTLGDFKFVWLLNNDAVADKKALFALKSSLENNVKSGVSGSLILNYPDNGLIQCAGVKYHPYLGVSQLILKNKPLSKLSDAIDFDYLNGASLFLRLEALETVGFFDEKYFLYSEEFDLQLRMKKAGYELHLCKESRVYHEMSSGTSKSRHKFYYYYSRSAVLLSKKHFSFFTRTTAVFNLSLITFIRTFPSLNNFKWGMKGIWEGLRTK